MLRALVCLVVTLPVLAQEAGEVDTTTHSWAKWKPGSTMKQRVVMGSFSVIDECRTLKEVTSSEITITLQQEVLGTGHGSGKVEPREEKLPLQDDILFMDPTAKETGQEALKVKDKEYACTVLEVEFGGTKIVRWMAKEAAVPLKIVKTVKSTDQTTTSEDVAVDLAAEIRINGKKFSCTKYKTTAADNKKSLKTDGFVWLSPEVPGGVARREETDRLRGAGKDTTIVLSFDAKKK